MKIEENENCGKRKVWKIKIVENRNCGKWKLWKMETLKIFVI
jgi:hypothetical protein